MQRGWDELAGFYDELTRDHRFGEGCAALADLCRRIGASHLGAQLFGHSSHACLVLSQTETGFPPEPGHQFLRLTPDGGEIAFELEYWATRGGAPWSLRIPSGDLPDRFDSVLRQLGWNYHPIGGT